MLKFGTKDNSQKQQRWIETDTQHIHKIVEAEEEPSQVINIETPKKFITHIIIDQVMISSRTQMTNLKSTEFLYQLLDSKVLQTKQEVSWTKAKQLLAKKCLTLICRSRGFSSLSKNINGQYVLPRSIVRICIYSQHSEWRYQPHEALQPLVESFLFIY